MQEVKPSHITQEPQRFLWIISLSFFSIIAIATIGLFAYGFIQANTLSNIEENIAKLESEIAVGSQDKDVIVANILSNTMIRPSIDLKALVNSFRAAASSAGVRLSGFNVDNDTISTSLIATTEINDSTDPIKKIITMMRVPNPATGLSLEPIYTVGWTSLERTTSVTFKVLTPNTPTNVIK